MKKTTIIMAIFLSTLVLIPAYIVISQDNGSESEEECMPIVNLPPDPVFMSAQRSPAGWEGSQFKITLSGIMGDYDVMDGAHPGWCLEYGRAFNTIPIEVHLLSSYDTLPAYLTHENWPKVNYILNHKQGTPVDVQRAIWYFVNFGTWEWDYQWGPYGPITPETYSMIDDAIENADDWCPLCCDVIAVICDPGAEWTYQLMIIEVPLKCYEFEGETAWAANGNYPLELRYTPRGNWATYVAYGGEAKTVTLFAGKTINVGTVEFSAPADGIVTITITLTGDWVFEDVSENVKIQDYAKKPSGNPAPGLFAHKATASDSPFSIDVPENNFYGVHVNVGYWVEISCED